MKFLLIAICFPFTSCTQRVFLNSGKDRTYAAIIHRKKFLSVSCRDWRDEKDNVVIEIWKNNCDTVRVNGLELISQKPLKRKYYFYLISQSANNAVSFTETETFLLNRANQILDSMGWCHYETKFVDWKMIGFKTYVK